MENRDLDSFFHELYNEINDFYVKFRPMLGSHDRGFKILYGPPRHNAPIMFIGDQPGGSIAEDHKRERYEWSPTSEYATGDWALARNMQSMFGPSLLRECVGLNSNFFRAPSAQEWSRVDYLIRQACEKKSIEKVLQCIKVMAPQLIVSIGIATLKKFCSPKPVLLGAKGRPLIYEGRIGATRAIATLHLSGARISTIDRTSIASHIRKVMTSERG